MSESSLTFVRRGPGRPPKTSEEVKQHADAAFAEAAAEFPPPEPLVEVVIKVKRDEAWRCPWVEGRITQPNERLRVPVSLAQDMARNDQAIILENTDNG